MEKTFDFGKIDLNDCGRKINKVEVTVELTEDGVFCASALVWNSKHTDIECGGQCLDELVQFLKTNKIFMKIYDWWKKYHLNNMHPGTEKQENALTNAGYKSWANNYNDCCNYLETIGLLVDDGYEFGTGWLKRDIPNNVLKEMKELLFE